MNFFTSFFKILLIMAVLVAFLVPGYILRKKNMLGEGSTVALSNILLYVCQPLIMIRAFALDPVSPTYDVFVNMLWAIFLSLVSILCTFALTRLVFCREKNLMKKNVYSFAAMFSNCGFIGIPFIDMMTDGDSLSLFYIGIYNVAFNILIWTLGIYFMTGDKSNINLKRAFLNPSMIGSYIGLLLMFIPQINIFTMADFSTLAQIPEYFGCMTSILSMFIVGIRLADVPVKSLFTDKGAYASAFLRLIAAPVITFIIILFIDRYINAFYSVSMWLAVLVASAMSPASSVVAYAEAFGGDKVTAARVFILGTLLSVITIPLLIGALNVYYFG